MRYRAISTVLVIVLAVVASACSSGNADSNEIAALTSRVEALEKLVPFSLSDKSKLAGNWTFREVSLTGAITGTEATMTIDAEGNYTIADSTTFTSLPCEPTGTVASGGDSVSANFILSFGCFGGGPTHYRVISVREDFITLIDYNTDMMVLMLRKNS